MQFCLNASAKLIVFFLLAVIVCSYGGDGGAYVDVCRSFKISVCRRSRIVVVVVGGGGVSSSDGSSGDGGKEAVDFVC